MLVALDPIFKILDQRFRAVGLVEIMFSKCEERARVGVQLLTTGPQIVLGFVIIITGMAFIRRAVNRISMQHPRLHVGILFLLHQVFIEIMSAAIKHLLLNIQTRVARQRQTPHHIRSHPMLTVALLPPTPATNTKKKNKKTKQAML